MFFRWDGNGAGTKSAWNDGRNWKDAAGSTYAQAIYPGQTATRLDDVVLDTAVPTALAGYAVAQALNSIRITTGYCATSTGAALDVGSGATPVACVCADVIVDCLGSVYLEGTAATTGLSNVRVEGMASSKTCYLDGVLGNVTAMDDATQIVSGAAISGNLILGASGTTAPTVTIETGVTLPSSILMLGGTVVNSSAVTTLNMFGGEWTQSAGNITTLNAYDGTFYWNGGNITTINSYGGSVSAASATNTQRVTTINAYSGGEVDLRNNLGNVRVTSYINNQGGTVSVDEGIGLEEYRTREYAGASDAVLGVSPQSVAAGGTAWGSDVYVGVYDRLEVIISVGASDSTVAAQLFASSDATHGDEAAITDPAALEWEGTDDNKAKKLTLYGYQLTSKTSIRLKVAVTGGSAALVSAAYQVFRD